MQKGMKERKRDTTPKTVVERQVDGRKAGRGRIGSGDREGEEQRNPLAGSEEEQYYSQVFLQIYILWNIIIRKIDV